MVAPIPRNYAGQILELGAGTGAVTARLAARCPRARILACEVNPTLARDCAQNLATAGLDTRVQIIPSTAEQVLDAIARRGNEKPGYVLSGLPLGNFARDRISSLLEAVNRVLRSGGWYIQFQYSLLDRRKIKARFPRLKTVPVLFNLPPAVVYYAQR
jgi:phospholipid N-methyltransferase